MESLSSSPTCILLGAPMFILYSWHRVPQLIILPRIFKGTFRIICPKKQEDGKPFIRRGFPATHQTSRSSLPLLARCQIRRRAGRPVPSGYHHNFLDIFGYFFWFFFRFFHRILNQLYSFQFYSLFCVCFMRFVGPVPVKIWVTVRIFTPRTPLSHN